MRKGQLTAYVIVGIVLILGIAGLYIAIPKGEAPPPEIGPITQLIESCLEDTAIDGIDLLSLRGGDLTGINTSFGPVALGYNGQDILPPIVAIEKRLNALIDDTLLLCIQPDLQLDITSIGTPSATTAIRANDILITLSLPLTVSQGSQSLSRDRFSASIPVPFMYMYKGIRTLIENTVATPEITLTVIDGYELTVLLNDASTFVYMLKHPTATINSHPLIFVTAIAPMVTPPTLQGPLTRNAFVGQPFIGPVRVHNPNRNPLRYFDDTAMFDISQTGAIEFTPSIAGEFSVLIEIADEYGNHDSQILRFIIRD